MSGIGILLPGMVMMDYATGEFQLLGVNVKAIDVVEDAFSVVDDATRGGAVAVS